MQIFFQNESGATAIEYGLIAALIIGFLVFGDWPDGVTLLGAAIVVATGLFTLYRESVARRKPQPSE